MTAPISNRGQQSNDRGQEASKGKRKRKKLQDEIIDAAPPSSPSPTTPVTTPPATTSPVATPPVASSPPSSTGNNLQDLATRYVAQYEQYSGKTLSEADRKSKISEVYDFYSDPGRAGRLANVVVV